MQLIITIKNIFSQFPQFPQLDAISINNPKIIQEKNSKNIEEEY